MNSSTLRAPGLLVPSVLPDPSSRRSVILVGAAVVTGGAATDWTLLVTVLDLALEAIS